MLFDKIGPGTHPCHWCQTPVTWSAGRGPRVGNLIVDHLNWDTTDDSPENLVPSCVVCNSFRAKKGDRHLIEEEELFTLWGGQRTRAVERFCVICGERFLSIPAEVKKGKGLYCSRSCAGKGRMLARQK